jgi:SAM-dependent methyltransferase
VAKPKLSQQPDAAIVAVIDDRTQARNAAAAVGRFQESPSGILCEPLGALCSLGRSLAGKARTAATRVEIGLLQALHVSKAEQSLIEDSQRYWNDPAQPSFKQNSHWRGVGVFADDANWRSTGHDHLSLYHEFARALELEHPLTRVVEWGCGGGMNAVDFAPLTEEFCGVDISSASLEECARQVSSAGHHNFTPILIGAADPEAALVSIGRPCDLFISTYVFELLPTPEYGVRVLKIAHQLLAPGGMAMIQIKYCEADRKTAARRWSYVRNLAWNATYRVEEFWQLAQQCGFTPKLVTLVPQQTLVGDRNYAYFFLINRDAA